MKTLDQMLDEAAKIGGLTALTIYPTSTGWQCNARRRSSDGKEGWRCVIVAKPSVGARDALSGIVSTAVIQQPIALDEGDDGGIFG